MHWGFYGHLYESASLLYSCNTVAACILRHSNNSYVSTDTHFTILVSLKHLAYSWYNIVPELISKLSTLFNFKRLDLSPPRFPMITICLFQQAKTLSDFYFSYFRQIEITVTSLLFLSYSMHLICHCVWKRRMNSLSRFQRRAFRPSQIRLAW